MNENAKPKGHIGKNIGCCLLAILLSPILILGAVLALLYTPIEYLKYRISPYGREMKLKYVWLISSSPTYKVYNTVRNNKLPIEFKAKAGTTSAYGYFTLDNVLILQSLDSGAAFVSDTDNEWHLLADGKEHLLTDYLESELDTYAEECGSRPDRAVILMKRSGFESEAEAKLAEDSGYFILFGRRTLDESLESFVKQIREK